MEKNKLDFILKKNNFLEGGIKEACIKARDFIRYSSISEEGISSKLSCVSDEEFLNAVKTLIAFSFGHEDAIPETWICDSDCKRISQDICPGECNINKDSSKQCPYFIDEGLV